MSKYKPNSTTGKMWPIVKCKRQSTQMILEMTQMSISLEKSFKEPIITILVNMKKNIFVISEKICNINTNFETIKTEPNGNTPLKNKT